MLSAPGAPQHHPLNSWHMILWQAVPFHQGRVIDRKGRWVWGKQSETGELKGQRLLLSWVAQGSAAKEAVSG